MELLLPDELTYGHTYRNIKKIGFNVYTAIEYPGRQVVIKTKPNDDDVYSFKISHEEGGIYLLTCLKKIIHKYMNIYILKTVESPICRVIFSINIEI